MSKIGFPKIVFGKIKICDLYDKLSKELKDLHKKMK
jgi:hypothetical protein